MKNQTNCCDFLHNVRTDEDNEASPLNGCMSTNANETEIKFRLRGPEEHGRLRTALTVLGARPTPATTEDNTLFDTMGTDLAARRQVLRLRTVNGGPRGFMTFKGPATFIDGIKSREEIEYGVDDAASARATLLALGYQPKISYGKVREAWYLNDAEIVLDTLEFGWFCEIEAEIERIDEILPLLGLLRSQAERDSYPTLARRFAFTSLPSVAP